MRNDQQGFTLVELMVSMAIGTVIILGAGQLFLTTFQTFRTVDQVSRKQEALIFAVSTLSEAGRKGEIANYAIVSDQRSSDNGSRYYCVLQDVVKNQPLVDIAQVDEEKDCPSLSTNNDDDVSHTINLPFGDCRESGENVCDEIRFIISERNKVITSLEEPSS